MQNAAVESVALIMADLGAFFVFRHHVWGYPIERVDFWETTLKFGLIALVLTAPLQVIHGDLYAQHVYETQPQKFAAMEAVWETDSYVPEYIVAVPTSVDGLLNPRAKDVFGIGIPGGASWLASHGDPHATITGLEEFEGPQPPVAVVFWSFRLMVAIGFWFVLLAGWGAYRWRTGDLLEDGLLHKALMASTPLGVLAVEVGWIVTEVGRQPWVIQGEMKRDAAVSQGLTGAEATVTLVAFAVGYLGLLTLYLYVVGRIVRAGPPAPSELDATGDDGGGDEEPPAGPDGEVSADA